MKIAIFGGTFNPVHKGHIALAKYAITFLNLDQLFFVPVYRNPFRDKEKLVDASHRLKMLKLVIGQKMKISEFEVKRKGASYTVETVKYFRQQFPDAEIFLLIGSDNVNKMHKWKDFDIIKKLSKITVFKRKGAFLAANLKKINATLLANPVEDFSSTIYREGNLNMVEETVQTYIANNYLYVPQMMERHLGTNRLKHSQAVAALAPLYAKAVGIDPKKAWLAGSFHDITKDWTNARQKHFLTQRSINEKEINSWEVHALTGALWVKEVYGLLDEEVYNAILKHTSLDMNLSELDKVIFAADKLARGRKWEGIQEIRNLILLDFEKGFKALVKIMYESIETIRGPMDQKQHQIYQKWM